MANVFALLPESIFFLHLCMFVGNAENVAGLKDRVKAAQDKTKELLKALNGSREMLNAIPDGRSAQKTQTGAACDSECVRVYVCVGEKNRRRQAGSIPGQAQLDACQGPAHGLEGAQQWEGGLLRPRSLPKLRLDELSWKQREKKSDATVVNE